MYACSSLVYADIEVHSPSLKKVIVKVKCAKIDEIDEADTEEERRSRINKYTTTCEYIRSYISTYMANVQQAKGMKKEGKGEGRRGRRYRRLRPHGVTILPNFYARQRANILVPLYVCLLVCGL